MENNLLRQLIMLSKQLMYTFLIQLFLCTVLLANTGNAQRKNIEKVKISMNLQEKPLAQFFKEVESKTDFKFTYTDNFIDLKYPVTVEENNTSLYDVLVAVSIQTHLNFVQVNENIHVKPVTGNKRNPVEVMDFQEVTVSGKVVDDTGEPLPGATITVVGTTTGTITDIDGNYSITVPDGSVLVFSFIGHDEDALYYKNLSDTVKQHFNRKFFNPETALYGTEEAYQTYQLIALIGDVVPDGYRDKVFQTIVEDIKMRDDHLNTGIIGTKYLWPVLVQGGENELAYRVATQTTWPSFGYWLKNDATTLLEKWSGENSHNHQMFGSITEYFYKFLAGIQSPMEGNTTKGYKNIHIAPYIPKGLDFVNASLVTVAGKVASNWKKETDVFTHEIIVPANSSATVALPLSGFNDVVVFEGGEKIWDDNNYVEGVTGIKGAEIEANRLMVKTGSGSYHFRVENK